MKTKFIKLLLLLLIMSFYSCDGEWRTAGFSEKLQYIYSDNGLEVFTVATYSLQEHASGRGNTEFFVIKEDEIKVTVLIKEELSAGEYSTVYENLSMPFSFEKVKVPLRYLSSDDPFGYAIEIEFNEDEIGFVDGKEYFFTFIFVYMGRNYTANRKYHLNFVYNPNN